MSNKDFNLRLQESIIGAETVLGAIAEAKRSRPRRRRDLLDLMDGEPALQEFLKGALLEMAGEMAIHGCPPSITGAVYRQTAFLLAVTFNAVQQAHRDLYADLLPQTEADANAKSESPADRDPSPGPDGGKGADRPSKKEPKP